MQRVPLCALDACLLSDETAKSRGAHRMSGAPTELKNCLVFVLAITKMSQVIKRKEEPNQGVKRSCNDTSQPRKGAAKGGVGEREAAHASV